MTETFTIVFKESDMRIEVRWQVSEIVVWERGTGYPKPSMKEAMQMIEKQIGHTNIDKIVTNESNGFLTKQPQTATQNK